MVELLSYREAAALVHRSPRTIRHWHTRGYLTMTWETRDGQKVRVAEKAEVQRCFRERLANWPTHRWRLRKLLAEEVRHAEQI
jgi:hypothetical protein